VSRRPVDRGRRRLLTGAGIAAATLAFGGGFGYLEARRFEVVRVRRAIPGLRAPMTVALLTDLHLGPFLGLGSLERWVAAAADLEPDLVVYGGDLVDRAFRGDLADVGRRLATLKAPLGCYAVLGNHDRTRYPDPTPLLRTLDGAGIVPLIGDHVRVRSDAVLIGVDDWLTGRPRPDRDVIAVSGGGAKILVSHNPDLVPSLRSPIDLALCGHTHGGQICPPGLGPLVTSSRYGTRYAGGWVESPHLTYVSRGLGVTLIPARWRCTAELTLFQLVPA
jgi:predicted MPP superfamily phosphohydrolase